MDQSDSPAATPPPRTSASPATLGYHDRFLARSQSMSRTMALARGNSASGVTGQGGGGGGLAGILTPTTRRYSHRIGASVGKIEEKLKQMNTGESESSVSSAGAPMSPTWSRSTVGAAAGVMSASSSGLSGTAEGEGGSPASAVSPRVPRYRLWDQPMPSATSSATTQSSSSIGQESAHSSPKAVLSSSPVVHKRHTLPSFFPPPSLPAEPTTTTATTPPQRSPSPTRRTAVLSPSAIERDAALPPRPPSPPTRTFTSLSRGTTTTPGTVKRLSGLRSPWGGEAQQATPTSTSTPPLPERHSISSPIRSRYSSSVDNLVPSLTGSSSASTASSSNTQPAPATPSSTTISIRSPSPATTPQPTYRSSYMAAKRSGGAYPDSLGAAGGRRKFGRHMPRIASGDGNEDFEEEKRKEEEREEREARERIAARERARQQLEGAKLQRTTTVGGLPSIPQSPLKSQSPSIPQSPTVAFDGQEQGDVTGLPNRMRLSRNNPAPKTSATKFTIGLWADVQRHLLQAYEYLCHVGEAQQWIEGCLQEELPFGVVEMDEGLRNGVVLAKLARIWEGEALVRKIFEASLAHPKLQYKHSDNINYFFVFVRRQGLPESFIFELTDLYEKKNIPKVIYCIHALSHLLARKGLAQRIGNLLGQLQFSDDQLMQTQKGLTGVSMPNFKGVGRDLAKDMNVEPEPEPEPEETEFERRGRLLAEAEESIIQLQAIARGYLARKTMATAKARLRLAERYIIKLQSRSRGVMTRRVVQEQRKEQLDLEPWALAMQALARGVLTRRAWRARQARMQYTAKYITKIQAQARGVLVRRRFAKVKGALRSSRVSITNLQALARAKIGRKKHEQVVKSLEVPIIVSGVVGMQAFARAVLKRREIRKRLALLDQLDPKIVLLQAHARGVLVRRKVRAQLAKLDDAADVIVRIQAACRAWLAKQRLLALIRGLRRATSGVVQLQAQARAIIAHRKALTLRKQLSTVHVSTGVQGLQALARAALTRRRVGEVVKRLDATVPDVIPLQALARGILVRDAFWAWRDYLHSAQAEAIHLQSLMRGVLQRRRFREKMKFYKANLSKIVKVQALFRAKEQREQYRQLTMATNVTVGTIKNFVHLLDDSEADFEDEIEVERLRKKVVEGIRENQHLETEVSDLDTKISLLVQNVKSFEELAKSRRHGADTAAAHAARSSLLAAHGDPFSGHHSLDQTAKRKLERYQQLFYLLQTHSEYLARLFFHMSRIQLPEKTKRATERVVLTLFSYGQERREEFLILKLFQAAIIEEVKAAPTIQEIIKGYPMYVTVAVQYVRPKQIAYVREALYTMINEVISQRDLDLETDPVQIYKARVNDEETRTGRPSLRPKDVSFHEAVADPDTRVEFIRHLQKLHFLTRDFVNAITGSTRKMPYGMRCIARELLLALRIKFPNEPEEVHATALGQIIYYRFLNPAIVTPETFDIVPTTITSSARRNLAEISKMLTQITSGAVFGEDNPCLTPLNSYVSEAIAQWTNWLIEVADVPEASVHFHANEFLDATVQPKPIYITPNEVYAMHSVLVSHLDRLPAKDLVEALLQPVTEEHELLWEDIVDKELVTERMRMRKARMPSTTGRDDTYRLEDIRSLSYQEVKKHAIYFLLELEKRGKITRGDGYQGVLNAIATDVRSKHWKRVQRKEELDGMNEALTHLKERKKYFSEQIDEYNKYVESSMETMQRGKGKKRIVLPFTKQYFHLRGLQKAGKAPQFGSFRYSAQELYDKGILLSIDQTSPRQFDKIDIIISSDKAGVFTLEIKDTYLNITKGSTDLKMEELLQAQYEHRTSLSLFDGMAKVNLNLLLYQINKKSSLKTVYPWLKTAPYNHRSRGVNSFLQSIALSQMDLEKVLANFVKHGPIASKPALIAALSDLSTILQTSDADITSLLDALIHQIEGLLEAVMTLRNDEAFTFRSRILKVVEKSSRSPHPTLVTCAERVGAFLISLPPWIALDTSVMQEHNALSARVLSSKKPDVEYFIQKKEVPAMASPPKSKEAQPKSKKKRFVPLSLDSQNRPQENANKSPTSPVLRKHPTSPNDATAPSSAIENFSKRLRVCFEVYFTACLENAVEEFAVDNLFQTLVPKNIPVSTPRAVLKASTAKTPTSPTTNTSHARSSGTTATAPSNPLALRLHNIAEWLSDNAKFQPGEWPVVVSQEAIRQFQQYFRDDRDMFDRIEKTIR
ncbi:hypothetical protein FRC01_001945 [Tulasnella sp. 417]|nr:hypothetical protein FRC01_001945 [Tulasnella sp. 417]